MNFKSRNQYSFLQKLIHKTILGSRYFKKLTFKFEKSMFLKSIIKNESSHIFIIGLARSGTTLLLNGLYKSGNFASLTYNDMPFPLAPNFWALLNKTNQNLSPTERIHKDGIMVDNNSPESFEEVFWSTYENDDEMVNFNMFISSILKKNKKDRYLSKNNQSIRRIQKISKYLNNCLILVPFRDPLQQCLSLKKQHNRFIKMQNEDQFITDYMQLICHREFGVTYRPFFPDVMKYDNFLEINHWLEQWYFSYDYVFNEMNYDNSIHLVSYEKLCKDSSTWNNILEIADIKVIIDINAKLPKKHKENFMYLDKKLLKNCHDLYSDMLDKSL